MTNQRIDTAVRVAAFPLTRPMSVGNQSATSGRQPGDSTISKRALLPDWRPCPKGASARHAPTSSRAARLLVDLLSQLARRRDHNRNGALALLELRLVHDVHDHGQHKGGGLAGACLGNALRTATGSG